MHLTVTQPETRTVSPFAVPRKQFRFIFDRACER
jgi:hypothetical protein